jgi:5-methylcytosine-specific restriction endonuclease McrA
MDIRSFEVQQYRKLYDTAAWKRLRKAKLQRNPCCERCLLNGYVEIATIVHHIKAHKGDIKLFYSMSNLQSLCKPHHDGEAHSEEMKGYSRAVDKEGWPTDPRHPLNARERK